ncbi:cytochrome c-type biogenesis protein [Roseateles sp. LKC17W]|uniref:Cytochrome c-type biogenesis protein n=1 Tax=Pelomonas margarita TaxID=3299031 RepID=A0ABW7FN79_9BURK
MRRVALAWLLGAGVAVAGSPPPAEVDARVQHLATQLRCLVCQNQTLADSHAPLALDLKAQVREQVQAGRSDDEVLAHLTARYGDFVRYKPPLKASTWLLWLGPVLLFGAALAGLVLALRRRAAVPAQDFDPDPDEPPT